MTRAEAVRVVCKRLTRDVDAIAPPGIGKWDRAWQMTAAADRDFRVALAAWEATGTEANRLRVRDAYDAVLDAWREAAQRFAKDWAR